MAEGYHSREHRLKVFLFYTVCALKIVLAASCGSENNAQSAGQDIHPDGADTASAHFSIQWHTAAIDATPGRPPIREAVADCSAVGVAFVTCDVYDEFNAPIASAGPWPCDAHEATIDKIQPGSDRTFVVLGWNAAPDEGGDIVYQGSTSGIDLTPGEVADVGTIDAIAFVPPAPASTAVYGNRINLSWEDIAVPGLAGYHIYRNGEAIGDTQSLTYSDINLIANTEYCHTVSAYDFFGHESSQSDPICQTTPLTSIYYRDNDQDGYGDPADSIQAETRPPMYVADNTDCDNNDDTIHPGALEVIDEKDNDCDGSIDEVINTYYRDSDGDGYGNAARSIQATSPPDGYVGYATDCDDTDRSVHPNAAETCNGRDDDCDGGLDEDLSTPTTCGVGQCSGNTGLSICTAGQWSDTCDPLAGATAEVCDNADNDCDGSVDEDLSTPTTCGVGQCSGNTGLFTCTAGQPTDTCDPLAGATAEVCDNADNDCDGNVDEGVLITYYHDFDRDGYGSANSTVQACSPPPEYVIQPGDCNDDDYYINPRADETAGDNIDNDCNGQIDDYRFTDMNDGTIRDNDSALIWLKDATCGELSGTDEDGKADWDTALTAAATLCSGICGLTDGSAVGDWRLPTPGEWQAFLSEIYAYPALDNHSGDNQWSEGDAFNDVKWDVHYWSSTEWILGFSYVGRMSVGDVVADRKNQLNHVWPVRNGN